MATKVLANITKQQNQSRSHIRETGADLVFTVINTTVLLLFFLSVLYPLVYVVSASFSNPSDVVAGRVVLLPVNPTLRAYITIFEYERIWTGYMNSLFYAIVGTTVNVIMTIIAAYPLSRRDLVGRNPIMFLFVFTMLFSGGLIPLFITVNQVGLYDTRWALIIPQALSVWNLMIAVTYFRTSLPQELLEAAQLDGCNDFNYLLRIVLPLSTPIIAVLALFYAIGHWNQFFAAIIFLGNKDLFPLQIILRDILIQNTIDLNMIEDVRVMAEKEGLRTLLKFALIVVASGPVMIIYPFVQKYFVQGLMIGAIKG